MRSAIGWAERGGMLADGPGNSVPRFHLTLGTGPGVMEPFEKLVRDHAAKGKVVFRFRHQVDNPFTKDGQIMGIRNSLAYSGDGLARTVGPHKILDPAAGTLIAIRMNILTRKTLGGCLFSGRRAGRAAAQEGA